MTMHVLFRIFVAAVFVLATPAAVRPALAAGSHDKCMVEPAALIRASLAMWWMPHAR
jgi:hypothetical protein